MEEGLSPPPGVNCGPRHHTPQGGVQGPIHSLCNSIGLWGTFGRPFLSDAFGVAPSSHGIVEKLGSTIRPECANGALLEVHNFHAPSLYMSCCFGFSGKEVAPSHAGKIIHNSQAIPLTPPGCRCDGPTEVYVDQFKCPGGVSS